MGYGVGMKSKRRRAARKNVPPWITNPPPEPDASDSTWMEREAEREVYDAVRVATNMGLLDFVVLALGVIWCEWWHGVHRVDDV